MAETIPVRPGQVWADNDPRVAGRTLRVDVIEGEHALCTVLTNAGGQQRLLENPPSWWRARDNRGKQTRISLRRFRPTSTGYRLIKDAEEQES